MLATQALPCLQFVGHVKACTSANSVTWEVGYQERPHLCAVQTLSHPKPLAGTTAQLPSNYTTLAISVAGAEGTCKNGKPPINLVETNISSVQQVRIVIFSSWQK